MIETVARSIVDELRRQKDNPHPDEMGWVDDDEFPLVVLDGRADMLSLATAAMRAMMEPTWGMVEVFNEYHKMLYNPASTYRAEHTWQAMLTAALEEPK